MRCAIVTNAYYPGGLPEYVGLTDAIKARWCDRAGWDYIRTDNPPPEPGLTGHWAKIAAVESALEGRDAVVWMDCDAAPVADRAREVEAVISRKISVCLGNIVMIRDCNGLNSGVFSVSSPLGLRMWREAYALRDKYRAHPWAEQAAFMEVARRSEWRTVVVSPPPLLGWNQYPWKCPNQYRHGDWVLHVPAKSDAVRASFFRPIG